MKILISLNQIKELELNTEYFGRLLKSKGKTKADDELFPVSDILKTNGFTGTLWVLGCLPEHKNLWRKLAWWCANEVLHKAEDVRVKECLDVVWRYIEGEATYDELVLSREVLKDVLISSRTSCYMINDVTNSVILASYAVSYSYMPSHISNAAYSAACSEGSESMKVYLAQKSKLKEILDTGVFVK